MTSRQKIAQAGFTLVELAIVLLIVGLLISGILKGQELIENSRTTATIQQTKSYEAAINTFRDSFGSIPGDSGNANTRVPGCQGTNTIGCQQGNGDGMIATAAATNEIGLATGALTTERAQFWLHLALSNMLTGVTPNYSGGAGSATATWGSAFPSGRLAGGFLIGYSNGAAAPGGAAGVLAGHAVTLQGAPNAAANTTMAISAARAVQMDMKLDDGVPATGDVIAIGSAAGTGATNCYSVAGPTGVYNAGIAVGSVCSLAVRVMN